MFKKDIEYLEPILNKDEISDEEKNDLYRIFEELDLQDFRFNKSVESNYIDEDIYNFAIDESEYLKKEIKKNKKVMPFFEKLCRDIFNLFYKATPRVYHEDDMYESLKIENKIIKELFKEEKIEKLRENTVYDMFNSTYSLEVFQRRALDVFENWSNENKDKMEKLNEATQEQQKLEDLLKEFKENKNFNTDEKENESLIEKIKKQLAKLMEAEENINVVDENPFSVEDLINGLVDAIGKTEEEVSEAADAFEAMNMSQGDNKGAGNLPGSPIKVDYNSKKKLIEYMKRSRKFRYMISELGRIKETISKVNKKPSKFGQTVCDVGVGNIINRLLSTEKVKLVEADLEYDFYKKYIEKGLLEYKTQGMDRNKGPIIVCVDDSGSMIGNLEIWAKAIAIASVQIAIKEKRNARVILFSDSIDATFDFCKNNINLDNFVNLAEMFYGGGTSFCEPLKEALESIEESNFKKSDILFITDGDPFRNVDKDIIDRINNKKKYSDLMINTILLSDASDKYVKPFSDNIIKIDDLSQDQDIENIFANMQR